jgi:hypothetical protein
LSARRRHFIYRQFGEGERGDSNPDRRDHKTTLIYADYAPCAEEAEWVEAAFKSATPPVGSATDTMPNGRAGLRPAVR